MFWKSHRIASVLSVTAAAIATAAVAGATSAASAPVGPLPPGPVAGIQTQKGELIAVALPHRANGRVWRIARALDPKVLAQVSEADVGSNVVVVFKATGTGTASIFFGLTRGETRKAYESRGFRISVR